MSSCKPPKLVLSAVEDKYESVDLWLDQFNDWCILQGWRDTSKTPDNNAHWKDANHAQEISAFRLGLPIEVLKLVKSSIVPYMSDIKSDDTKDTYKGYPWVWQKKLLNHFSGQDTILAERMTFMETCKQRPHESVADFEARCKYHGSKCDYSKMVAPEQELIRDRFVTGIFDDKLRAELLHHFKEDGSVVQLSDVVKKAKAWEAASKMNSQVMQSLHTEEVVNHIKKDFKQKEKKCGWCGGEFHNKGACPANKPGVVCYLCGGSSHFARVCRSKKKQFKFTKKRASNTPKVSVHAVCEETESSEEDDNHSQHYALSLECVNNLERRSKKLFTQLALSAYGKNFVELTFQVDSGSTCNTLPYDKLMETCPEANLKPSKSTLVAYSGDRTKSKGKVQLLCEMNNKFELLDFEIVDSGKSPLLGAEDSIKLGLLNVDRKHVSFSPAKRQKKKTEWLSASGSQEKTTHSLTDTCTKRMPVGQSIGRGASMSKDHLLSTYADVFKGKGCIGKSVNFTMDASIKPVHAPNHRLPLSKRDRVKKKLDEMVQQGKLVKVEEPTDWCSNMTVVEKVKPNGELKVRICIDPSQTVNKGLVIPKYTIPTLSELLPQLSEKQFKCFTIMDALDGFTQVTLSDDSSPITTMQTPWGRYRWAVLPYGISSAPEEFQLRMHECIDGLSGIANIADDCLIFGLGNSAHEAEMDHDRNLIAFLERARERKLKLNPQKIQYKMKQISFMGHNITEEGISADPRKVSAINELSVPDSKKSLLRFLGMVNYLNAFCPSLSTVIHPLYELSKPDTPFQWSSVHDSAFRSARDLITNAPCLAFFDRTKPITLQVDASESGLGGALLQPCESTAKLKPVAYMSCQMRKNEVAWAQIEKETLAICAACEKWNLWLYGRDIEVHSDHQPLETIFKKPLAKAPKRLQRLMMRLQRYNIKVVYKKGSSLVLADTLSRAPLSGSDHKESSFDVFRVEVEQLDSCENPHLTPTTTLALQSATKNDQVMADLANVIMDGWPANKSPVPEHLLPYWSFRDELSINNGIIYKGVQAVIPLSMQREMLKKIHSSHMGAASNLRMCRDIVFWPGFQAAIKDVCQSCGQCAQYNVENQKEPMKSLPIPEYPWQWVSQDLFKFSGDDYLVTVDHFSDFIEVDLLENTLSATVITKTKAHFARHGMPENLLSDNGPQFISADFEEFCQLYSIKHLSSSPYWPKGNGKAESAVKIIKSLLRKTGDMTIALLHYRNTPQQGHSFSPVQRSMGRRTRCNLPVSKTLLIPQKVSSSVVRSEIAVKKTKSKKYYDCQSNNGLPNIDLGEYVYAKPAPRNKGHPWYYGKVTDYHGPRSLVIDTEKGVIRRNRAQVRPALAPPVSADVKGNKSQIADTLVSRSWTQGGMNALRLSTKAVTENPALTYGLLPTDVDNSGIEAETQLSSANEAVWSSNSNVLPTQHSESSPVKTRVGRESRKPDRYDPSKYK